MGTTRQEVNSTFKVLILGSSVSGGLNSPEAQVVAAFKPGWPIDVVTPAQWQAMTPAQFMSYHAIIIGDASCTSGTAAFQAAIDTRHRWGPVIDGDVVIIGTNPASGSKPQIMTNGLEHLLKSSEQFRTGLYVSLGCAYQNAPAGTEVTLLDQFGDFRVQGSTSNCTATQGHSFQTRPTYLSRALTDLYLGRGGCAARSVFTTYPAKNFSIAAIGLNAPGNQEHIDYTIDAPNPVSFFGTPYILVRGAVPEGSGCGGAPENVPSGEECDMGDGRNGVPGGWGTPASETCSFSCHLNWCGDGEVNPEFGEECDNGIDNGRTRDARGDLVNGMCTMSCKIVNLPSTSHPPTAQCRNVTVSAPANACGAAADINNGSSDPDGDLVTCTQFPAGPYNLGTTTVTLTCRDAAENTATCQGTVTVRDVTGPVVTIGAPNRNLECNRNIAYADLNDITATDLCSNPVSLVSRSGSVSMGTPGTYPLTYTARDAANNPGTATRTVTVSDTLAPSLTLNGSSSMAVECGGTFTDLGAIAADQCAGNLLGSIVRTGTVNAGAVGQYQLRYNVSDPAGLAAPERIRTVNVQDTVQPTVTILGPINQTVECNDPAYQDPGATASDQCAGTLPATPFPTPSPRVVGTQTISYRATDPSGNVGTSTNSRTLTVRDTLPPAVTLNGPATMGLECATPWTDPGAAASDQCVGNLPVTVSGTVNNRQLGVQTIAYTATDLQGLSDSKVRAVTVNDTLAPSITVLGPLSQSVQCNHSPYADPGAVATDSCVGDLTAAIQRTGSVNTGAAGTYTLSYRVTDPSGNQTTAAQVRTVTVVDDQPPTISLNGPANSTLECGSPYNDPGATANDVCFGDLTANIVRTGTVNGNVLGAYTLHYTVTDPSNLSASTQRQVTVNDTLAPTITVNGPLDDRFECGSTYVDPGATASDVCAGTLAVTATRSGSSSTPGQFTITYSATDPSGNTVTSPIARTVRVNDDMPPTLTLVGPATQTLECGTPWADPGALANDVCFGDLTAAITRSGNVNSGAVGSYVVAYNVMDPAGLSAPTLHRAVSVTDTLSPTLTLNGPLHQQIECGTPYNDPGATASDICAGDLSSTVVTTGSVNVFALGNYPRNYSVTDPSGHSATASRAVTVNDTLAPQIQVRPGPSVVQCNGTPYVDPGATASDLCTGDLTQSISVSSNLDQTRSGQYTVTYRVADASGNLATAVRPLTVGPCSTCINIRLNDYNLFLLEDYTGGHDVLGKVAAGGNITMENFSVGHGVADNNTSNVLVAGGNLSLNHGSVGGDARYGGSYSTNDSVTYLRGSAAQGTPIDFAARFVELRGQSAQLAALPSNGTTQREVWGGIMMHGTSSNVNVFDVNASAFNGAVLWNIEAPAGSFVVVNIHGASANFGGFGINFAGGINQHGVLFNFVDATNITAQGFGFWGTVLAPYAHIDFSNGSWDGGIYAKSFHGTAEGHINPLSDRDICP